MFCDATQFYGGKWNKKAHSLGDGKRITAPRLLKAFVETQCYFSARARNISWQDFNPIWGLLVDECNSCKGMCVCDILWEQDCIFFSNILFYISKIFLRYDEPYNVTSTKKLVRQSYKVYKSSKRFFFVLFMNILAFQFVPCLFITLLNYYLFF